MIDLDNLPEDKLERCRLLGMDESLLAEGEDLMAMLEEGAIAEISRKQETLATEQTERRKRRKVKEDARKAAELKKAGTSEVIIKLEVGIMKEGTFEGSSEVKDTLGSALKARAAGLTSASTE